MQLMAVIGIVLTIGLALLGIVTLVDALSTYWRVHARVRD